MQRQSSAVPTGVCQCGCGQPTQPVRRTNRGVKKGEYPRFIKGHWRRPFASLAQRFWAKVDIHGPLECWLWLGGLFGHGYGQFQVDGRAVGAHIVAYQLAKGEIPPGVFVLHNCPGGDNKRCCNPAHLWLGSTAQNTADAYAKGHRAARGEGSGASVLTEAEVREIRRLHAEGVLSQADLADSFGVARATIWRITNRLTWQHLT